MSENNRKNALVTVEKDTEEEKTKVTLSDPHKAEEVLIAAGLPDYLKEDIAAVLDAYGDLDYKTLAKTVYEKYPAYAKKSHTRKGKKNESTLR